MLIDFPDFQSVNRLDSLPPGDYFLVESVYDLPGLHPLQAIVSELLDKLEGMTIAMDLQILYSDGTIQFRDFAKATDGEWRDSYGAKAATLPALLPRELSPLALVQRRSTIVRLDEHKRLVQLTQKG